MQAGGFVGKCVKGRRLCRAQGAYVMLLLSYGPRWGFTRRASKGGAASKEGAASKYITLERPPHTLLWVSS